MHARTMAMARNHHRPPGLSHLPDVYARLRSRMRRVPASGLCALQAEYASSTSLKSGLWISGGNWCGSFDARGFGGLWRDCLTIVVGC